MRDIELVEDRPVEVTRAFLQQLPKGRLFELYTRCLNDEMSPIMWRGFTKKDILQMFLAGADSVTLTPFISDAEYAKYAT